ncbi:glycosyltransferase family 2 protein [Tropicibacter naphthalenivorans]|uniref:Glycosyl transferase family 2 n=1 Tax=Tropicibacter naphthalenivorans TaxID=441103 RepID=A0A0P1GSG9_9RHOB|nr:glycosyltransferase family 2 protein [Tropicibacter naphthalenivorans]CUH77024.1 hypothetical protein TRN7648_01253 [Tropicibacter naphthalenivorans]SMC61470.1 Glycosyl transferase family 2 [Tropicibacter naphthalenivorans]
MRIYVHIGPDAATATRLQQVMDAGRDAMLAQGVLFSRAPGARNHTRLFMAVTDPDNVDVLRYNREFVSAAAQEALQEDVARQLLQEAQGTDARALILSAHQLGNSLVSRTELQRLKDMLTPISDDIRIVAHLDDPARLLVQRYGAQLLEGRNRALDLELACLGPDYRSTALATRPDSDPAKGQIMDVQGASFWLDFKALQTEWESVFGAGSVSFHSIAADSLYAPEVTQDIAAAFGIDALPPAEADKAPRPPSAAWLTRCRLFNDAVLRLLNKQDVRIPRPLWRKFLAELKVPGAGIKPGALHAVSQHFAADIAQLCAQHPGLDPAHMAPDAPLDPWQEAGPTRGFRATQYLMAFRPRIDAATAEETQAPAPEPKPEPQDIKLPDNLDQFLSPAARTLLPPEAKLNFIKLQASPFAPHNRIGRVNEELPAPPYTPADTRPIPDGSTGRVIVACMKNEAPYILEWIAYHRAIGFDNFLIYTNDCEDGTQHILTHLQSLGIVQHRDNSKWRGKSPQQHALDKALKEPIVQNAAWVAHLDVDEFINIRCGNGTVDDLLNHVPDATHIAMTWRLFGHGDVTTLQDRLVIEQFDACAPKYCPKPHTVWGFKTFFRNTGAYGKLSCHRPNKLQPGFEASVKWVNGSGVDMTDAFIKNGWRSSQRSIGYDLVQLNHYALRSLDSFLVKRQRGRALHVDRTIGLNYWVRMDWNDNRDVTIQRNIPRVRAAVADLLADPVLADLHARGLAWHQARAETLRNTPEFADLAQQALQVKLTETERVAYSLTLDMET